MYKKRKENSNADRLSQSTHMVAALPLEEDEYAEFYDVDELVIRFEGGINQFQSVKCRRAEIPEEQRQGLE